MVAIKSTIVLNTVIVAGIVQHAVALAAYKVDLRCAVIVNEAYANAVSDAGRVFQSASIPYSEIVIPSAGLSGKLPLENSNGHGKYSCIVKGPTAYNVNNNFIDMMTADQYAQLQEYEAKYSVRRVVLESNPDAVPGMATMTGFTSGGLPPTGTTAKLTAEWKAANPRSIVKPDVVFNLAQDSYQFGLYTIGAYIKAPISSLTPFLTLNKLTDQQQPLHGMVVEQDCTKSWERLHLFLSTRNPDANSVALSYVWAEWVTKGLFIGARRILFSTQVDDFFLPTELWDKDPAKNEKSTARVSAQDVTDLIAWQKSLNALLPKGSNVKLELAYNGLGVAQLTRVGEDPWDNPVVLQYLEESPFGWQKPNGTGTTVWKLPNNKFTKFSLLEFVQWYAKDALFAKCYDQTVQSQFFWLTHTYTHLAFFNITTFDADIELTANEYFAEQLGLLGKAHYSPNAMVTPRISGIFNGDALKTIKAHKINSIVGDNSQPALVPWTNRYHGWFTNSTTNGFNDMFVIPRFALNIYFHMADFNKNLELYNIFYNTTSIGMTDLPTFFERESWRCAAQLLALLMDPYMTHQANLVMHNSTAFAGISTMTKFAKQSLATLWMEKTLEKVVRYVNLPIKTQKQQDLEATYRERMALDSCGHVATASVGADGKLSTLSLTAPRACNVPLTGAAVTGVTGEADAGDVRSWIALTANTPRTVTLTTPYTWWTTSTTVPTVPPPAATTVIANPMVVDNAYWWVDGKGYTLATIDNKTCGSITGSDVDANGAFQQVELAVKNFTSGVFTVAANFSASNLAIPSGSLAGFYIDIGWADGTASNVQLSARAGSYGWSALYAVVNAPCKVPSTMYVHILLSSGVTGALSFTDVVLYQGIASQNSFTAAPVTTTAVPTVPTTTKAPTTLAPTTKKPIFCIFGICF